MKHGREDLEDRAVYFDVGTADVAAMPAGSLVLCRVADEGGLLAAGLTRVAPIPEPDGVPWFTVLQK